MARRSAAAIAEFRPPAAAAVDWPSFTGLLHNIRGGMGGQRN
jgi:hypothetical protein